MALNWMPELIIISGRSLADYYALGERPDPAWEVTPCGRCGQPVVLSPAARIKSAGREGIHIVLCNSCVEAVVRPHSAEVITTETHDEQKRQHPYMAKRSDKLIERLRKK